MRCNYCGRPAYMMQKVGVTEDAVTIYYCQRCERLHRQTLKRAVREAAEEFAAELFSDHV